MQFCTWPTHCKSGKHVSECTWRNHAELTTRVSATNSILSKPLEFPGQYEDNMFSTREFHWWSCKTLLFAFSRAIKISEAKGHYTRTQSCPIHPILKHLISIVQYVHIFVQHIITTKFHCSIIQEQNNSSNLDYPLDHECHPPPLQDHPQPENNSKNDAEQPESVIKAIRI